MAVANYHLHAKFISRSNGSSAIASAAYRRGASFYDDNDGRTKNYLHKQGVAHSEISAPDDAPEWVDAFRSGGHQESEKLWNMVEKLAKGDKAQLAKEVEFSLPVELDLQQNVTLAREFIEENFAKQGMIADWSMHTDNPENPHVHVMLTTKPLAEKGFAKASEPAIDEATGEVKRDKNGHHIYKSVVDWHSKKKLIEWRESWASIQNEHLKQHGHHVTVDHRSYEEQGIALTPMQKIGLAAMQLFSRNKESERVEEHHNIIEENRKLLDKNPEKIIAMVNKQHAVFTENHVDAALKRYYQNDADRANALDKVMQSSLVFEAGIDKDAQYFTTKEMVDTEKNMINVAQKMTEKSKFSVKERRVEKAMSVFDKRLLKATKGKATLSEQQKHAIYHVMSGENLSVVVGLAGAGKTTIMEAAHAAWSAQGYRVKGAALSGIAAQNLEESGIKSRTLHSLELRASRAKKMLDENVGRSLSAKQRKFIDENLLSSKDVLVVDEAGMIGSRQMNNLFTMANDAGAKVVLVGDHEQLQSIEGGAAFRNIIERVGFAELSEVRRQKHDWMREATQQFATKDTHKALDSYQQKGHLSHQALYDVKAAPEPYINDKALASVGFDHDEIRRYQRVEEFKTVRSYLHGFIKEAKEQNIKLHEHDAYDVYQNFRGRMKELATTFKDEFVDYHKHLAHHDITMNSVAASIHSEKGAKRVNYDAYAEEYLSPSSLDESQREYSDAVKEGLKNALKQPEIRFNQATNDYLDRALNKTGLDAREQENYKRVAEYVSMKQRSGQLWNQMSTSQVDVQNHASYSEFMQTKTRRDVLAKAISQDYDSHVTFLEHHKVGSKDIITDMLVAEGYSRNDALAAVPQYQSSLFSAKSSEEEKQRLAQKGLSALPTGYLSKSMTYDRLVQDYMDSYHQDNGKSRVILAYTKKDVKALNDNIRAQMKSLGTVSATDHDITVRLDSNDGEYREKQQFATGDRIMFRDNNDKMGVKNGTLGTIEKINDTKLRVRLDNDKIVEFNAKEYDKFQSGYAATVHKSQGVTVDEAYVLASKHYDSHTTYVAMTRHKSDVKLYASQDEFSSTKAMKEHLSASKGNKSTLDYVAHASPTPEREQKRLDTLWKRMRLAYSTNRSKIIEKQRQHDRSPKVIAYRTDRFMADMKQRELEAGMEFNHDEHIKFALGIDCASKVAVKASNPQDCIRYMDIAKELMFRAHKVTPEDRLDETAEYLRGASRRFQDIRRNSTDKEVREKAKTMVRSFEAVATNYDRRLGKDRERGMEREIGGRERSLF